MLPVTDGGRDGPCGVVSYGSLLLDLHGFTWELVNVVGFSWHK